MELRRAARGDTYALIEWTMPLWQWLPFVWGQYTQIALAVSLTVIVKVVDDGVSGEVVGTKPEKNPLSNGWHGSAKLDCATAWF